MAQSGVTEEESTEKQLYQSSDNTILSVSKSTRLREKDAYTFRQLNDYYNNRMNPLVDSVRPDRWKKNVKITLLTVAVVLGSILLLGIPILAIDLSR